MSLDALFSRETLADGVSGAVADAISSTVLFPMDILKQALQTDKSATVSGILKQSGVAGLYKGASDKLIVSPQQKFQYFYFETFLTTLFERHVGRKTNWYEHLFLGYLAALQGTLTTIPLDVTLARRIAARKKDPQNLKPFWTTFFDAVR